MSAIRSVEIKAKEINKEIYFVIGAWGDCNWCKE